jgi:branched-chain amino acid transport system substrate-binding protein
MKIPVLPPCMHASRRRAIAGWLAGLAALCGAGAATAQAPAQAPAEVRIGMLYPLTGAAASSGAEIRNALELAADIINNGAPGVTGLPFAAGGGLPGLGGARIKLVFADHQGNPQIGATEAERLISHDKVVALQGAYFSNVTATASMVAERYKVPFLNAESSSASLTQRRYRWFFRTTPHDELFVRDQFEFLRDLKARRGIEVGRIATFNENTLWGNETTRLQSRLVPENGHVLARQVTYPARSTQLTSEVQTLKAASPAVVMQSSYLGDALLAMKTYKELGFMPDMILANNAGFTDTEFIRTLGRDADFVISREVWALDLAKGNPLIRQVDALFHQRFRVHFNGNSSRAFTGLMVLADAINRAGSTAPEAIRRALVETDMPSAQLIMPWKGVKFDATGQNTLGRGILVQIAEGRYHTVWPFDIATREVVWPMPRWDQRK